MVNEELVEQVRMRYQQGQRRDDIKADLMDEGWDEIQINAAIAYIQQEALRQIPGLGKFYKYLDSLDRRTAHSSPKVMAGVILGCFGLLFVISASLYYILDPLGVKTLERDKQRETDVVKIRTAIDAYYIAKRTYPSQLQELMPSYLQAVPLDPKTGASYSYRPVSLNSSYELCVSFEAQPSQCLTPSAGSSVPQIVSTPVPAQEGGIGSFDPSSTASDSPVPDTTEVTPSIPVESTTSPEAL